MIDTHEISVSLDGEETATLMKVILHRLREIPGTSEEAHTLMAVVRKMGPGIRRKVEQFQQLEQLHKDGLN